MRVALVEDDGAAHHLHQVNARQRGQAIGDGEPVLGTFGADLHLDQLVIVERLRERGEERRRRSQLAHLDQRPEPVAVAAEPHAERRREHP